MTKTEEWRAVVGYEGLYEVSNLGRVRSVPRVVPAGRGTRFITSRVRKLDMGHTGYLQVGLCNRTHRVHKLVAFAFLGPRPQGMEICHNDGDRLNNRASNLRYGTASDNQLDAVRHGTHPNARKTHCPQGHPYDEANTLNDSGDRRCRTCHYARNEARRQRKRAAAVTG